MARESRPLPVATPSRQVATAETPTSVNPRSVRTPNNQGRGQQQRAQQGLSASGRKPAPPTATPHARAAFRTIDSRRAAIFTPHRTRRRSVREVRETPRNFLLSLGKVLARTTEPIASSSSSPGSQKEPSSGAGVDSTIHEEEDDDDDDDLPRRPRLSLPIDVEDEDDDSDLRPHRSAGLEDENFTVQSIELPRRALNENTGSRFSMGSTRMSDYFNRNDMLRSEDIGADSGFFPPLDAFNDNFNMGVEEELDAYDRLDSDAGRRDTGQESDFGIEVPVDMNESTFVIAPEIQDSPTRQPTEFNDFNGDGSNGSVDLGSDGGGFNELMDRRSYDDDDDHDRMEEEPLEEALDEAFSSIDKSMHSRMNRASFGDVGVEAVTGRASAQRSVKKRGKKVSKYGIEYPSLPPAVVKRLAQTFAKTSGAKGKITPDALQAIMQASEWFFEQLGDDLQAFAHHAHRKTIDESDMLTLMKRYASLPLI
ncbi:centromere kinetochore component CENP-T-domain-containing protein [Bombardia bombarda]|uniref:Centromere kinetochore component CENP-T-domain-containing protein n=1 Tax=Bombardia bombarda TaxID=252184 RepID=A0AA39X7E3_9PEZI|nr:centromere kinetochore component CENP-T-domain-containing protein [Bombardia bombarda]